MAKKPAAPRRTKGKSTADVAIIGQTGLMESGGWVTEEFLADLSGLNGLRRFKEMALNDPTCGALLFAITTLLRNCDFNIVAVDETPEAEAAKEFCDQLLTDMDVPFSTVIDEICSMFTYGFAPFEINYKLRTGPDTDDKSRKSNYTDNLVGIRSISLRSQLSLMRWDFDPEDGAPTGMWQSPPKGPAVFIPMDKMVLFRTTAERNNPQGRSILRSAYRPWFFKKRIEEIEAIGIERDLAGLPIVRIPGALMQADADAAEKQAYNNYKRLVRRIKRDQQEGIVLPSDRDSSGNLMYDLTLLATGGSRQMRTTEVVDRYDKRIAMSVLADFILLGQSAVGSFSLSSDKTELFAVALGAFAKDIANQFNETIFKKVWRLNGFDPEVMPKMEAGDLESTSLTEIGALLDTMTKAGAPLFPDPELEKYLRSRAGLPPPPEEGEDLRVGAPGSPTDPNSPDHPANRAFDNPGDGSGDGNGNDNGDG